MHSSIARLPIAHTRHLIAHSLHQYQTFRSTYHALVPNLPWHAAFSYHSTYICPSSSSSLLVRLTWVARRARCSSRERASESRSRFVFPSSPAKYCFTAPSFPGLAKKREREREIVRA
eukprot:529297-Rhodomonas_salina.5